MSDKVLLDTSIIIDLLRQKDKEKTFLYKLSKMDKKMYVSIITHTELHAGKSIWERKGALEDLQKIFSGLSILNLNEEISKKAGEIRAKVGTDLIDAIIASTAIMNDLPLVTLNVKHFENVPTIKFFELDRI